MRYCSAFEAAALRYDAEAFDLVRHYKHCDALSDPVSCLVLGFKFSCYSQRAESRVLQTTVHGRAEINIGAVQ